MNATTRKPANRPAMKLREDTPPVSENKMTEIATISNADIGKTLVADAKAVEDMIAAMRKAAIGGKRNPGTISAIKVHNVTGGLTFEDDDNSPDWEFAVFLARAEVPPESLDEGENPVQFGVFAFRVTKKGNFKLAISEPCDTEARANSVYDRAVSELSGRYMFLAPNFD